MKSFKINQYQQCDSTKKLEGGKTVKCELAHNHVGWHKCGDSKWHSDHTIRQTLLEKDVKSFKSGIKAFYENTKADCELGMPLDALMVMKELEKLFPFLGNESSKYNSNELKVSDNSKLIKCLKCGKPSEHPLCSKECMEGHSKIKIKRNIE